MTASNYYELMMPLVIVVFGLPLGFAFILSTSGPGTWRRRFQTLGVIAGLVAGYLFCFWLYQRCYGPKLSRVGNFFGVAMLAFVCSTLFHAHFAGLIGSGFDRLQGLARHAGFRRREGASVSRWRLAANAKTILGTSGIAIGVLLGLLMCDLFRTVMEADEVQPRSHFHFFEPPLPFRFLILTTAVLIHCWLGVCLGAIVDRRRGSLPAGNPSCAGPAGGDDDGLPPRFEPKGAASREKKELPWANPQS